MIVVTTSSICTTRDWAGDESHTTGCVAGDGRGAPNELTHSQMNWHLNFSRFSQCPNAIHILNSVPASYHNQGWLWSQISRVILQYVRSTTGPVEIFARSSPRKHGVQAQCGDSLGGNGICRFPKSWSDGYDRMVSHDWMISHDTSWFAFGNPHL